MSMPQASVPVKRFRKYWTPTVVFDTIPSVRSKDAVPLMSTVYCQVLV